MTSKKVIDFYTQDGDLVTYRPLSARLPEFLREYGPAQGFSVETEIMDAISLKPGLLRLYEIVLQAGRKPEEAGLPALVLAGQTQVCRATLRDENGRVWATATAAKLIQVYKDLEVLETAARQRLLAALGFGGEGLDADENLDQRDQGLTPAPQALGGEPTPVPAESTAARITPSGMPPAARETPIPPPPVAAVDTDATLVALRRQLVHQATIRGVEPPVVATREEARTALKRLMQGATTH